MGLFGKRPSDGARSDQSGRQPGTEYAEISKLIIDRLSSEQDERVLMGIGDIMRGAQMGRKYRPSEAVDMLAEVLQFPHGKEVAEKAGDALVEKLRNGVHEEDAELIITNRLGRKNEANAKFFLKMLERLEHKPRLRKLAVEMLAGFRGFDLSPETIDNIEMTLLERLSNPGEHEEVKKTIRERFRKGAKGRPELKLEEIRLDETIATETEPDAGQASFEALRVEDIPAPAMDAIGILLLKLKDGDPDEKKRAAVALEIRVGAATSRSQIERIREGVSPMRVEFPDLYRKILLAMQKLPSERNSTRPPIALGPQNGKKPSHRPLGDKDPTPVKPIKTG